MDLNKVYGLTKPKYSHVLLYDIEHTLYVHWF